MSGSHATADTHPPAIEARGLTRRFGPVTALAPLDWRVARGETVAVLGPNGAGKTTLLRLLSGLMRPSGGELAIGDAAASPAARRARVGLLAHATFLYGTLTARENLVLAGRLMGVADPDARAERLLGELGLERFAERAAGAFSRGMAQRLAIGRALVHDPELLLLDEPFTGLDPPSAERLAERLRRVDDASRTRVLVTHDLERAAQLATRVLVLSRGRVVHEGAGEPDAARLAAVVHEAQAAGGAGR